MTSSVSLSAPDQIDRYGSKVTSGTAGGRTVLLITHRPEGLDLVDEVVELGRHFTHIG